MIDTMKGLHPVGCLNGDMIPGYKMVRHFMTPAGITKMKRPHILSLSQKIFKNDQYNSYSNALMSNSKFSVTKSLRCIFAALHLHAYTNHAYTRLFLSVIKPNASISQRNSVEVFHLRTQKRGVNARQTCHPCSGPRLVPCGSRCNLRKAMF